MHWCYLKSTCDIRAPVKGPIKDVALGCLRQGHVSVYTGGRFIEGRGALRAPPIYRKSKCFLHIGYRTQTKFHDTSSPLRKRHVETTCRAYTMNDNSMYTHKHVRHPHASPFKFDFIGGEGCTLLHTIIAYTYTTCTLAYRSI